MEGNLNAIVNSEDDERCLKTLFMSYKQLPVHLKPCFLYMGIYPEDHEIRTTALIKLWVAEGFLKPISGKRLEEVARAYLNDLVDRNLIMIHKVGSTGSIKECKVHDLLRDLCLREALKEGFYTVYPRQKIGDWVSRIVMSSTIQIDALSSSARLARSCILYLHDQDLTPHVLKQLRRVGTFIGSDKFNGKGHQLVNSRALAFSVKDTEFPSLICRFWNLHTLTVSGGLNAPTDIWNMSHIRHLDIQSLYLPDPPPDVQADGIHVLENLQTMGRVWDFTCSDQMVKRIPNITKLRLSYGNGVDDSFCLTNLDSLDKLESLNCYFKQSMCLINYPQSLKKLTLTVTSVCWDDMLDKIGALPLLQKLKLEGGSFEEGEWETSEEHFRNLKFLSLGWCLGLKVWTSEASHFPRLEQLHLQRLINLEEIPLDFAEISTLGVIELEGCSDSAAESAKTILEEQEALYGEEDTTLRIRAKLYNNNSSALRSLASSNFCFPAPRPPRRCVG